MKNHTILATMPTMPRMGRASRPLHGCACGCGMGTKSTWAPGHDGRATGWAIRVERAVMTIDEVPANERAGALIMLERRAAARKADTAKVG